MSSQYLSYLIDPSFQGVSRLFVLSFEDSSKRASYRQMFSSNYRKKDHNVMIDRQNVFDQPVENNLKTYDNIRKNCNRSRR